MKSHFLYGAILGVSLLGAFLTWTEEPDPISGDEIELLSGKLEDLQEILLRLLQHLIMLN